MIELAKKILLSGLSVLISLCFVELYFWMRERTAIEPAEVAHLVGGPVMRARDEPLVRAVAGKPVYDEPVPRESAFLCLGDSFAFSWGVSDTGTFTFYLQKRLNHGKYFGRYRVYNLGRPATGLKTHSKIYEKIEKKLPHSLVLIVYGNADIMETYAEIHNPPPKIVRAGKPPVLRRTAAGRRLLNAIYRRHQIQRRQHGKTEIWEKAKVAYQRNLIRLVKKIESNGAKPLLIMIDCDRAAREFVRTLCDRRSILYYEQEFLCTMPNQYHNVDGHFNRKGNRRLAEEVCRYLKGV